MSEEFLSAIRRAHGMPIPERDAKAFNDADVEAACHARNFRAKGLTEEQMLETTRVLGRGLAQAAEVMRAIVLEIALEPGADELELAERYRAVVQELVPMTAPMLEGMLQLHLRNVLRTEAVTAAERESGKLPGARDVGVAFADLVGFTKLGEQVPPDELGHIADRLSVMTADV